MNLSKSKYCNGIQCKKMLWLDKNKPEVKEELNNDKVLETGNFIHEIARYLFGEHINIEFNEDLSEMIKNTYATLESYKDITITEASFNYNNNFCSVDILKKKGNKYEIYEVKSSSTLKDIYIKDASYQYYVLTSLGLNVTKVSIVYLNRNYIRYGNLDLNKLFIKADVTENVVELKEEVASNIKDINEYMESISEPDDDIGEHCFTPYECPFFKYCSKHLPPNNIFNLTGMSYLKKSAYYKKGLYKYEDLIKEKLKDDYKRQMEYELYDKEDYIDHSNIKKFMSTLTEPIYFLDFETYQIPIPLYDGLSPYSQIPFQYSLHILKNNELSHKEYLAESGVDPRRKLAEALVNDIPENVTVLAYNMSFEKTVIKRLAEIYPDLSEHLLNIKDNIKDLMIPFQNKWYYTKNMHGSYSIKYVLPALFPLDESLNYHNLDLIHNGSEAMSSFADLENKTKEEQAYIRERLLRYCELDTYAMVKIYEKLKEITCKL